MNFLSNRKICSSILFWGLLWLSFYPVHGQNTVYGKRIDSLVRLLPGENDTHRADIFYELGYEYVEVDNKKATEFGWQAFSIAMELHDSLRIVKGGRVLASGLWRTERIDSAAHIYDIILTIARKRKLSSHVSEILNNYALLCTYQAKFDKALELHFESLDIRKQTGNKSEIARALYNIGLVYYKLNDSDKALKYFQESLKLKRSANVKLNIDRLLVNIGLCYVAKNDFAKARDFVDQAFQICGQNCSDVTAMEANVCLGLIEFGLNEWRKAEGYFKKSYALAKKNKDDRFILDNTYCLARIYIQQNNFDKAIQNLREAEELINGAGSSYNTEYLRIYSRFSEVYLKMNDFKQAALYQRKYIELKNGVYNEELMKNLMKVEASYLEKQNQAEIASQKQILLLKEEVIKRQGLLNVSISIVAIVLIILSVVLVKNNRQKRLINDLLEIRVKERTKELELNRNELQRSVSERDLLIEKTAKSIRSSLASIKGICDVGLKDVSEPGARLYIKKVEETSDALSNTLDALSQIQRRAISDSI